MSVVVSDMYSVILDAGVQAAISAGTSGPAFNITGFQLGSSSAAQGATAVSTATGVDNPVYTGLASQIYYALLPDSDACLFRIVLDESVGNFAVGQICLMIGNTAFSKSVLYQQQNKWQSNLPSVYGNNISFDLVLAISDAQSCINLTTLQSLYAMLPEVTDETQLPAAGSTLYNTYIVRNHTELGIPAMAVARNSTWNFTPCRLQAGQGEAVIAVPPAMFDVSVAVNMAVYFNYTSGTYLPADPTDQNKFPVGIRTSLSEVTQTGYVSRYMAGTSSDIWPSNLTLNTMYSVQVGTPGIPGLNATYQAYGIAVSNNLMYVDLTHSLTASWLDQNATVAGVQPLDVSHKHQQVTETVNGFMSAADKTKLDNPASFVIGTGGITTLALPNGQVSVLLAEGMQGFVIAPDVLASGLYPGSPVCLQIISGVRTWVAADPAIPALRPIGVLNNDSTRVITTGNVVVSVTVPVPPPAPGNLPTLSLTSDNPATIVNGVETPVSPSTSPTVQASTTIGAGTICYAGEGVNAGTIQLTGNWIIGIALSPTLLCVDFDAIASIADHTNALTAAVPVANKNATPAGILAMLNASGFVETSVLNSLLTGVIADFPVAVAPTGWLTADGSNVSRTVYANLFNIIGTSYGTGNGTSTFTLPDYRGVFRRGLDNSRGLDNGRALGSYQADKYGSHNHGVSDPGHLHNINDPGHSHPFTAASYPGPNMLDGPPNYPSAVNVALMTAGSVTGITINASVTGISIQSSGATETAPKNVAVLTCIKY